MKVIFENLKRSAASKKKSLAVLIDPEKFSETEAPSFLKNLPETVTHIFVGGSTAEASKTDRVVKAFKDVSPLPLILFPGDCSQISERADGLLFLSLISGRNPEYLIEQQVKSVSQLRFSSLEIIPTGYILIDGGRECAVQRVSNTMPLCRENIEKIVHTAIAGQFSGKQLIYLEAGSGAVIPVSESIISEVKRAIDIPLIVGGGIRKKEQLAKAYNAGADMVVIGTAFENGNFSL